MDIIIPGTQIDYGERTELHLLMGKTKSIIKEFGDAGYRSRYLSHAKRALYHLSYTPLKMNAFENVLILVFSPCLGTDLNRNSDVSWSGIGASDNTCSQTYYGVGPFSEPAMKDLDSK